MPKLRYYDHLGTARFVTFTCYRRHRYLSDTYARQAVLNELASVRERINIRILGYVIMPEHVHLLVHPPDNTRLGPIIGQLKACSARAILSRLRSEGSRRGRILQRSYGSSAVWQRRCYDHNCRTTENVVEKLKYCHDNPVRRGLVSRPEDWPWSSYRWYHERRDGVFEINGIEV